MIGTSAGADVQVTDTHLDAEGHVSGLLLWSGSGCRIDDVSALVEHKVPGVGIGAGFGVGKDAEGNQTFVISKVAVEKHNNKDVKLTTKYELTKKKYSSDSSEYYYECKTTEDYYDSTTKSIKKSTYEETKYSLPISNYTTSYFYQK